jgi:hypothetical protein
VNTQRRYRCRIELCAGRADHRLHVGPAGGEERRPARGAGGVARRLRGIRAPVLRLDDRDVLVALEEEGVRGGADVEVFGLVVDGGRIQPHMGVLRMGGRLEAEHLRDRRREGRLRTAVGVVPRGRDVVDSWPRDRPLQGRRQ